MLEIMGEDYPRRQKLLTEEVRRKLPKLYETEHEGLDAQARVKFFTPDSNWTWYAAEFDGEDTFYGLVIGLEIELGYFSLSELEKTKGALGLPIERDRYFEPRTLKELMDYHEQERRPIAGGMEDRDRQQLIDMLSLYAERLGHWDKRIVEILGIGNLAKGNASPTDVLELICTFNPSPLDENQGFFSI